MPAIHSGLRLGSSKLLSIFLKPVKCEQLVLGVLREPELGLVTGGEGVIQAKRVS